MVTAAREAVEETGWRPVGEPEHLVSFQPLPGQAGYAASKAFVLSFSESLHTELHGSGVTVTAP